MPVFGKMQTVYSCLLYTSCITAIREKSPQIKIETLVPDFRGRMDRALDILTATPPDVLDVYKRQVLHPD